MVLEKLKEKNTTIALIGASNNKNKFGNKIYKDLRSKAINDLVALVSSLAHERGRNATFFANMIKDAASYTTQDAFEKQLIDGILDDRNQLETVLQGRSFNKHGEKLRIEFQDLEYKIFEMDFGQKLLDILAHPNIAYILFLLGAVCLYFEFQAMGGFVAGALGVFLLILSAIGFQVLPLNFGALGLIVLAFALFLIEIFITSYGLLSLAGLLSLIFGSLFLFRTDDAYIELSRSLVFTVSSVIFCFMLFLAFFIFRDFRKNKVSKNYYALTGKEGKIIAILKTDEDKGCYLYQVKVSGEIWQAQSQKSFELGDSCEIQNVIAKKMMLII